MTKDFILAETAPADNRPSYHERAARIATKAAGR